MSMFSGLGLDLNDDCNSDLLSGLALQEPSTSTDDLAKVLLLLKEKERDLELTARIGASLVEQNKELQERNEFLEESLSSSNDAIAHLRHELRQRNRLYRELAHLSEEDDDVSGREEEMLSANLPSTSRQLQESVRVLENENNRLKAETARLQNLSEQAQKQENNRVRDCLVQLEQACTKVTRLQGQLAEKGQQCEQQTKEIKRLMHEVDERRDREEALLESNVDLNIQLTDAIENHEHLRIDIAKLQDRYLEVMGMLQETEDELRVYRQRMSAVYRTNSIDSLYDSLASELEASDSGCYNTPQFSARCDSQQLPSDREPIGLQVDRLRQSNCSPILEAEAKSIALELLDMVVDGQGAIELQQSSSFVADNEPFDIPSKALVNAVRTCRIRTDEPRGLLSRNRSALALRSSSAGQHACNEPNNAEVDNDELTSVQRLTIMERFNGLTIAALNAANGVESLVDESKDNTPIVEAMSFSTMSCQSVNTVVPAMVASVSSLDSNDDCEPSTSRSLVSKANTCQSGFLKNVNQPDSVGLTDRRASMSSWTVQGDGGSYVRGDKWLRSVSCSPIDVRKQDDYVERSLKSPAAKTIAEQVEIEPEFDLTSTSLTDSARRVSPIEQRKYFSDKSISTTKEPKTNDFSKLNKSSSSESLSSTGSDYEKPKLGEPGRLGTRDLDQSLRRLKLKQKLELDYEAFRQRRGLSPSRFAFYGNSLTTSTPHSSLVASPERPSLFGALSSQMNAMMLRRCDDCCAGNSIRLTSLGRANELMSSFREAAVKVAPLPAAIVRTSGGQRSVKFRGGKSSTINDISLAILAAPVIGDVDSTIVLRTQPNSVRRRASSLSKTIETDCVDSSSVEDSPFQRSRLQCSLRAVSQSPCLTAKSTVKSPFFHTNATESVCTSIAGRLGGRTWIPSVGGNHRDFDDDDETGLNFLSADSVGALRSTADSLGGSRPSSLGR